MTNYKMLVFAFVCIPSLLLSIVTAEESCDTLGVLFYEEMGCKPNYDDGSKCPISYECTNPDDDDTCLFQGKIYKKGERVDNSETGYNCNFGCNCAGKNKIRCGGIYDCVPDMHPNGNCYWRKENFKRCCFEQVCEPYPSNVTCNFEGKIYQDGQIILPKNVCKKCICKKDFRMEKLVKINCGFELFNADKIQNYCAPAYRKDNGDILCCPADFVCPSDKDQIIPSGVSSDKKCKYGDKVLNIGDTFEATTPRAGNVTCKCTLPPYVTCS